MLLILHTHVVAAARTMHELNPVEKVQDLAKLIVVNYTRLPQFNSSDTANNIDRVHLYAT